MTISQNKLSHIDKWLHFFYLVFTYNTFYNLYVLDLTFIHFFSFEKSLMSFTPMFTFSLCSSVFSLC